jgi:two-component system sensor histidine kinase KdpD
VKPKFLKTLLPYLIAIVGLAILTTGMLALTDHINPITVALIFLLFVLFNATVFGSKPAILSAVLVMLCFNYFFLFPIGTFTISETENWIALFTFFIVAITAGQLSVKAKNRAEEAERLYHELQNAFEKASQAEALRQSEKLKSALLDAVTHDLRTPLTSIKASITMLIEEHEQDSLHLTLDGEGRGELLEVINEETDRLNDFIQSMVELARIEAGELHLRKSRTDVDEIISNALQRAENLTSKHKIKVEIEDDLPMLSIDSKAIAEVVYNLLDNAAKYSPQDSKIEIKAKRAGDKIQFSIADEGKGIAETEREKVFQKFYRADQTAKGFGMGLAIVRGIVEAHEGRIWIEENGRGSKFVFDLPLKKA